MFFFCIRQNGTGVRRFITKTLLECPHLLPPMEITSIRLLHKSYSIYYQHTKL